MNTQKKIIVLCSFKKQKSESIEATGKTKEEQQRPQQSIQWLSI